MDENDDDAEVTVVAPTPLTAAVPPRPRPAQKDIEAWWYKWKEDVNTERWLNEHVPAASPWWRLWRRDVESLEVAIDTAKPLLSGARDRIVTEHAAAERSASLWYLSELLRAEQRTLTALAAHDAPKETVDRLTAVLGRIRDLAREVRAVTAP